MTYEVLISDEAQEVLDAAYLWLLQQTAQHATLWYNRVVAAIQSLEDNPQRCPLAPESGNSPVELRQLLVGDKQHAYRVIFTIRGNEVRILTLRHGARTNWRG